MKHKIIVAPETIEDYKRLTTHERSIIRDAITKQLLHSPREISNNSVKRLRGIHRPQYRLRGRDLRVYYDMAEQTVEILAIAPKSRSGEWLESYGEPES